SSRIWMQETSATSWFRDLERQRLTDRSHRGSQHRSTICHADAAQRISWALSRSHLYRHRLRSRLKSRDSRAEYQGNKQEEHSGDGHRPLLGIESKVFWRKENECISNQLRKLISEIPADQRGDRGCAGKRNLRENRDRRTSHIPADRR